MQQEVNKTVDVLKEGKIILYPTDTIWGIGCDATNSEAVKKIFALKKREESKAMIVLISEIGQLREYVEKIPEIAWDLVEFAENPLTVIYPKGKNVALELLASDGSIAIRLVKDDFCRKVIFKLRKAIASTSANISAGPAPAGFRDIKEEILNGVDYVVNWRQKEALNAKPSAIVKLELNGEIKFIRK